MTTVPPKPIHRPALAPSAEPVAAAPAGDDASTIAELRAAVAARDDFIAVAAHELRNPMTPIAGQVEILLARARREGASPATIAGLERLELSIGQYVRRATALLEISRVNAGHLRLAPTRFDLAALVADLTHAYDVPATRAGSVLSCDARGPVIGVWDRLATEQIVDNLVSNAIRYGEGKPIRVALTATDTTVALGVVDVGVGIAADDLARIFEQFEQAVAGGRKSGGFGVGLWLVRQLTDAMGGTIDVASTPGAGSTFTVRLPREIGVTNGSEQFTERAT